MTYQPAFVVRLRRGILYQSIALMIALACMVSAVHAQETKSRAPAVVTYAVVHNFSGSPSDGSEPSDLTPVGDGSYYGATSSGGTNNYGTVYKIAADGTETILYNFHGNDGSIPGAVIQDEQGNLYGTTYRGGDPTCYSGQGCGLIFKLAPNGIESPLHVFMKSDGSDPNAQKFVRDSSGNFYGTTKYGGNPCPGGNGCGVLFKLSPTGVYTIVYAFSGNDGMMPQGGLAVDRIGNIYGTTSRGGNMSCADGDGYGCGTIFKLAPSGALTVCNKNRTSPLCNILISIFNEKQIVD